MTRGFAAAVLGAAILVLQPAPVAAQSLSHLPVGHWSYAALARFVALGLIPSRLTAARPLTREEVARMVLLVRQSGEIHRLAFGDRDLLAALEGEFADDISGLLGRPMRGGVILGLRAVGVAGLPATPTTHTAARPGWQVMGEARAGSGRYALDASMGLASLAIDRAAFSTVLGSVRLQTGRERLWWGPGTRGALLLSDNAGPLDAIRITFEIPHIRYTKFAVLLEEPGRYLFGTRLDWTINDRFRIGVSEVAVAFPSRIIWYHLVNPIPVLITNISDMVNVQTRSGANDNFLVSIDFDLVWRPGAMAYGEVMIDDMLVRTPAGVEFPPRMAFQGGLYFTDPFRTGRTDLRIEYARVYNWTYNHAAAHRTYRLRSQSLGHWLGPDGDDLAIIVTHVKNPAESLQGWLALTRHGEGRLGTIWTSSDEAWQRQFLSGVVETRYSFGLAWERRSPGSVVQIGGEVAFVRNRGNVLGDDGPSYTLFLRLQQAW